MASAFYQKSVVLPLVQDELQFCEKSYNQLVAPHRGLPDFAQAQSYGSRIARYKQFIHLINTSVGDTILLSDAEAGELFAATSP